MQELQTKPNLPLKNIIKALVFASTESVNVTTICSLLEDVQQKVVIAEVEKINQEFEEQEQPFELQLAAGTLSFRTKENYESWVQQLFQDNVKKKLSMASLEVLSIIAYKQPITKVEIEEIRGVSVDTILRNLLERKFLMIVGRSSKMGSPNEYGTTKEFCRYFNIQRVPQDLPKFSEFASIVQSSELVQQIQKKEQEEKFSEIEPVSTTNNLASQNENSDSQT